MSARISRLFPLPGGRGGRVGGCGGCRRAEAETFRPLLALRFLPACLLSILVAAAAAAAGKEVMSRSAASAGGGREGVERGAVRRVGIDRACERACSRLLRRVCTASTATANLLAFFSLSWPTYLQVSFHILGQQTTRTGQAAKKPTKLVAGDALGAGVLLRARTWPHGVPCCPLASSAKA